MSCDFYEKSTIDFIDFYTKKNNNKEIKNIKSLNLGSLINFESEIQKKLLGQDEAIKSVSGAIKRATVGLNLKKKPIGSFIFCGPTGVGKTEMAKTLAKNLFNDDQSLIRFDMSEYMQKHTISKLIGTTPGYIGYGKEGVLTKHVREKPNSVILFDEVEKSDVQIMDLFLQVLDEGQLKDSKDNIVDFSKSIIILTSNIGANFIFNFVKNKILLTKNDKDYLDKQIIQLLLKKFRPEFINRLDEVIIFQPLVKETIGKILVKQFNEKKSLIEKNLNLKLKISNEVTNFLIDKAFNLSFGARQVTRSLHQFFENPLIDFIAKNRIHENDLYTLQINVEKNHLNFLFL